MFDTKESWTTWGGNYKGVAWEITRRNPPEKSSPYDPGSWWCSYILLDKTRMSETEWKTFYLNKENKRLNGYTHYSDLPLVFHGGITYYNIIEDEEVIKIGCDYNHLWDQERTYSIEDIYNDLKETIDDFRTTFIYKRWCGHCGKITYESQGILLAQEGSPSFICIECSKEMEREARLNN